MLAGDEGFWDTGSCGAKPALVLVQKKITFAVSEPKHSTYLTLIKVHLDIAIGIAGSQLIVSCREPLQYGRFTLVLAWWVSSQHCYHVFAGCPRYQVSSLLLRHVTSHVAS